MNTAQPEPELEDVVNLDHAASGMLLHLPAASRFALACTSRAMRDLHNAYVSAEEHARLLLHAHRRLLLHGRPGPNVLKSTLTYGLHVVGADGVAAEPCVEPFQK